MHFKSKVNNKIVKSKKESKMEGGAPPPIETVCAAIETLYHNPDPREKERASNWLQDLQKSVFAWKVSASIINRD